MVQGGVANVSGRAGRGLREKRGMKLLRLLLRQSRRLLLRRLLSLGLLLKLLLLLILLRLLLLLVLLLLLRWCRAILLDKRGGGNKLSTQRAIGDHKVMIPHDCFVLSGRAGILGGMFQHKQFLI